MTTLLQELSKRAAERWAAVLLGPGLLFVACLILAHHQRFGHSLDLAHLRAYVRTVTTDKANQELAGLIVIGALVLLGAAVAGLLAASAGRFVERCWLPERPWWYVAALTRWRAWRWDRADAALTRAVAEAGLVLARDRLLSGTTVRRFPAVERRQARRDRIAGTRPAQPTWPAQRMADAADRVRRRYGLDLAEVWPHVWTLASGELRGDIQTVRDNYAAAARLAAWAWGYAAIAAGTGWWPAAPLAAVLIPIAGRRAREAVETLATLAESAVDLHARDVAERLGVACPDAFGPTTAAEVNMILRA
ncbi:hypothetical protein [Streptomyces sp. NBC_00162]|uniref:hypothetical protein n=1 Tax=Streptomyces sp. NBC_00162 TaxID=2903629 RepID=UPI00214AD4E4|nr:hypothetical protein [Streptomyces sp. NBC_00162]UUU44079.1 hypothetical protein JIW86_38000 [Streptomyces sp. NBC_00162]